MGQRGPKPTPTAILKARGSWRGKANKAEPKPETEQPDAPDWLSAPARIVWAQVAEQLAKLNVLGRIDLNALARYCDAMVRWKAAAAYLAKNGDVYPLKDNDGKVKCIQPFPQVAIYTSLSSMLSKLEADFGMTPAARSRIQVPTGGSKDKAADPAEQKKSRFFPAGPALKMA